ncbi:hypothetical protein ACFFUB_07105 [Algimonas porphyrae]|uniref:WD40-like Beta Propeller Repeat n=1 Tax=Algimonas porphyrae TaxID=1128113 RepID=A0ABQ5V462_9PROT|nr:hypothetical protein [Algimonas porphyrae]GLQ21067.1 hypothetical protein GCM10007854_20220 [Algimonas porphyrae]
MSRFIKSSGVAFLLTLASEAWAGPERFAPEALGQDGRITLTPTFSPDGTTVYFAQSECAPIWTCPQRLKRATLGPHGWSRPEWVTLPDSVGSLKARVDFPSVSPDGTRLLFSWSALPQSLSGRDIYENFDLYSLDLTDPGAVPEPLRGPDLNRVREGRVAKLRFVNNETAPILTRSGDLYFWSERLDGVGERDIYLAKRDGQGGWLAPEPLPAPINSAGRDDGSWIDPSGRLMLVTYGDRGGSGGADLFMSSRTDTGWTQPVNLGPSVNSPDNDFAGMISPDEKTLYFSSTRPVPGQDETMAQIWMMPVNEIPVLARALSRLSD